MKDAQARRVDDSALAYLLLRAILGLNIFVHGFSRILAGPAIFAQALVPMFHQTPLPPGSVYLFGLALPWLEAAIGLFVFLGLATRQALIIGSLLILTLTFGATLRQDWESAGLQLIYAAMYSALLALRTKNIVSLDKLFHPNSL